jgi:hypothetical protein
MPKHRFQLTDHLVVGAIASLIPWEVELYRRTGLPMPGPVAVKLLIDTGSKRSSLIPGIIRHLDPIKMGNARIETGMGSQDTSLFWVRLEFHETNLFAIDHLAVARLPLPPSLANYHGIIGRDLLLNWESLFLEGRRKRFTIRDSPRSLLDWFRLR